MAWKYWSNPSSTGKWQAGNIKRVLEPLKSPCLSSGTSLVGIRWLRNWTILYFHYKTTFSITPLQSEHWFWKDSMSKVPVSASAFVEWRKILLTAEILNVLKKFLWLIVISNKSLIVLYSTAQWLYNFCALLTLVSDYNWFIALLSFMRLSGWPVVFWWEPIEVSGRLL